MEMPHTHCYATATVTLLWKRYRVHRSCYQGKPNMSHYILKLSRYKFPIQNGLKQGDAVSPLFFSFALEEGLKLNGTHQLLAYADDDNILEENIDTI
jgi:hypothetical protein